MENKLTVGNTNQYPTIRSAQIRKKRGAKYAKGINGRSIKTEPKSEDKNIIDVKTIPFNFPNIESAKNGTNYTIK